MKIENGYKENRIDVVAMYDLDYGFSKCSAKVKMMIWALYAVAILVGATGVGYLEYKIHGSQFLNYFENFPPIMAGPSVILRPGYVSGLESLNK